MEIKKNIPNNTVTRKLVDLDKETGNIYETVNIIARRANQIATELKTELNRKLADFSSPTDTMEETFENREQIEISRYYERLPAGDHRHRGVPRRRFLPRGQRGEKAGAGGPITRRWICRTPHTARHHGRHRRLQVGRALCRLLKTAGAEVRVVMTEHVSRYPQSEQVANFRKIDAELDRAAPMTRPYINAYTYYKIGRYKSAITAPEERPEGVPREQAPRGDHVPDRRRGLPLASNSVDEKQTDRYLQLLDSSLSFREEFPESKHIREVERMTSKGARLPRPQQKGGQYLIRHMEIKKNIPNNTRHAQTGRSGQGDRQHLRDGEHHRPSRPTSDRHGAQDRAQPQAGRLLVAHGHDGGDVRKPRADRDLAHYERLPSR